MTLNALWSDADCSYFVVDSARTHKAPPQKQYSVLKQLQRIDKTRVTVEEGAQKIVPLSDRCVAALCGSEYDCNEFLSRAKAFFEKNDLHALLEYLNGDTGGARLELALGSDVEDEPFHIYKLPARIVTVVRRGHIHLSGSLDEKLKLFLERAIHFGLIERKLSDRPEIRLVAALGYATTMAVHYNLAEQGVGGAFFGGAFDHDGFHWQPDITYLLYGPDALIGAPEVSESDAESTISEAPPIAESFDPITCMVRDGASISLSFDHGMVAMSHLLTPDKQAWMDRWLGEIKPGDISASHYFVFVPKTKGRLVIVQNDGKYIRFDKDRAYWSSNLVANLRVVPRDTEFELVLMS